MEFDYKVEVIAHKRPFVGINTDDLEKTLNQYGAEGYELIAVCESDVHIFKKAIK